MSQSNAVIYMLDSIGSEKNLYQVMSNRKLAIPSDSIETVVSPDLANDRLVYVISAIKEKERFTLSKDDLKQHQLSDTNMNEVLLYLKQLVGRNHK